MAIRCASCHFRDRGIPVPLRCGVHAGGNVFRWARKACLVWELGRGPGGPV